jgi:hypothetical protein
LMQHAQLGTYPPVAAVHGDQRSDVKDGLHATSDRRASPSLDVASSSSASVNAPVPGFSG